MTAPAKRDPYQPGPARAANAERTATWWRDAVVYQVYRWSYADSTGDGGGDLSGLIDDLDHLADAPALGVNALWLPTGET